MKVLFSLSASLMQSLNADSNEVAATTLARANTLAYTALCKVQGGSGTHKGKEPTDGLPNHNGCIKP
ncbi:hypothetical protein A7985_19695 [Pseudoalteromonas luteoviolacea]|uniref:Uncharacterized protein n=1 Tax=Pseudoalteromonas luteoviolacea TaxID=43657 RepID=A0A1C0TLA8_9GAMM|nr:hypothetical protein [Pseudoalteromonas luteoviolacea]MBQ4813753.1 hypothetical protein [Pseudoalteromonas luteoviolacea]OCQ19643.1 hypothetical protein A7985_19695 [Pseudoalteromonas luteoviolacea]